MKIFIVGLGSGSLNSISYGAYTILNSTKKIFFRTIEHPVIKELNLRSKYSSFDYLYKNKDNFEEVYKSIVDELINQVKIEKDIVYAVPGNPKVAEKSVEYLCSDERIKENGIEIEIVSSGSFLDDMFIYLDVDPIKNGLLILDALNFEKNKIFFTKSDMLFTQVYNKHIASELKLNLGEFLKDDAKIIVFKSAGIKELEYKEEINLYELDRTDFQYDYLTSVYIKFDEYNFKYKNIYDLKNIISRLRSKDGCPWDISQNKFSIISNMKEELEELIEAINNDDIDNTIEEIGDCLMLLVMQCQFADEEHIFNLEEVIDSVIKKLIFRHPHVFGNNTANTIEEANILWNIQKNKEKS